MTNSDAHKPKPFLADVTNLTFVLLGAFWTGTSTVFTGIKDANEVRDKIITGRVGDAVLTAVEKTHLFWWDWAPLKLSLAAISLVLFVLILMLPHLAGGYRRNRSFAWVCVIAALTPGSGAAFELISFFAEGRFLRGFIAG